MIKTKLIDSMKYLPEKIMQDILNIIPYNNRYAKSYLSLAKFISDDYHVEEVHDVELVSSFLFDKEYGVKLDKSEFFGDIESEDLNIHTEDTIYRAIMNNDLGRFITLTGIDEFDKDQRLESSLYPYCDRGNSLLELCCYHGAVDCFKLLRTKFNSEITKICLQFSFLRGNKEIMSECLKSQKPNDECMEYAIISHNLDFVTYLMNEHNIDINLDYCTKYNNIEPFLVYFDKTNDINKCFHKSVKFNPSLCEYRVSKGVFSTNLNTANRNKQVTYI